MSNKFAIVVDNNRGVKRNVDITKEIAYPLKLANDSGKGSVFGFWGRSRKNVLLFLFLGDQRSS